MFHIVAGSADPGNIKSSIRSSVPFSHIKEACPPKIFHKLELLYPSGRFYCWALSAVSIYKKSFSLIQSGDLILLKPNKQKGKRFFTWIGKIVYKTDSCQKLGQLLWKSGNRWERLLFLDSIEEVKIPDYMISTKLGLKENFTYQQTIIRELSENIDEFYTFCRTSASYAPPSVSIKS